MERLHCRRTRIRFVLPIETVYAIVNGQSDNVCKLAVYKGSAEEQLPRRDSGYEPLCTFALQP
jgi:hypothetical protein